MAQSDTSKSIRDITKIIAESGTELSVAALADFLGVPLGSLGYIVVKNYANFLTNSTISKVYDDIMARRVSQREIEKVNIVIDVAEKTFWELANKDGWDKDITYSDYSWEVAEHIMLEAMRQAELNKVKILGRFYGKTMYEGRTDWNDLHQITSMTGELSFRQLVLIYLINEDFPNINRNMFISNPHACVEIKQLLQNGIWELSGMPFSENNSAPIQIETINKTSFAQVVSDSLMLSSIPENDLQRVIDTLGITPDGVVEEMLEGEMQKEEIDSYLK